MHSPTATRATRLPLFVSNFIYFVHLSGLYALGNQCPSITPVSVEFYGATNQALNSSSYGQSTVPNAVICGRDCHADPNCKSFSYHRCSRVCELHNGTRLDTNLVETTGSLYFDSRQDTPHLSVEYLDDRYCSCKELLKAGYNTSGVYTIYPAAYGDGVRVHCDMDTAGGGWVTIQRRQDGSVNFFRNWTEYRAGFGNLTGEFWLGNAAIQGLTTFGGPWVIRFDFEDWYSNTAWAEYSGFELLGGAYAVSYDIYNTNSTAGNSLWRIKTRPFQTEDNHNNEYYDFPSICHGGWWYDYFPCGKVNLNGVYYSKNDQSFDSDDAIKWKDWKDVTYWSNNGLKYCAMKISEI